MDILPPDDGLQGLAPVEPRPHCRDHAERGAPDVSRLHDRRSLRARDRRVRRSRAVLRPGTDGRRRKKARRAGAGSRAARAGRDPGRLRARMAARRPLGRRQPVRVSCAFERDGRLREDARLGRRRGASCPGRFCRLAREVGVRPGRRHRGRHVLGAAGGRTAGGGRIGPGVVREAAPLSQPPKEEPRKPAPGDRGPQLRRHDRLFRPRPVSDPGRFGAGRRRDAGIRRPGAAGESGDRGRALHSDLRSGDERGLQDAHDEAASGLHLRAGGERPAGRHGVSSRQHWPRDHRSDDRGPGEVVRHPRARLRAGLPHPRVGWPDGQRTLRADASRHRASQSVLGGRSGEGSDRRTRRHLADAVPSVHREPRLPARAGFEARTRAAT